VDHSTDHLASSPDTGRGHRTTRRVGTRALIATAACVVALSTLAACGSDSDSGSDSSGGSKESSSPASSEFGTKVDKTLADSVPDNYKSDGIKAAVFNDWAPDEFLNEEGELDGWSVDLAKAIAVKLDVKIDLEGASFDPILPAIQNGRFDVGFASFAPIADRLPALDFVPEKLDGTTYASLTESNIDISEATDLCGHSVAVLTGAYDFQQLTKLSKEECVPNGKEKITIKQFPAQSAAELAMSSKRIELVAAGATKLGYLAKQKGNITVAKYVQIVKPDNYVSIGIRKGDPIGPLMRDSLQALIDDGTYAKILAKWGVDDPALMVETAVLIDEAHPDGA
jgi:polar amino acid transport system substrate-binding protein